MKYFTLETLWLSGTRPETRTVTARTYKLTKLPTVKKFVRDFQEGGNAA